MSRRAPVGRRQAAARTARRLWPILLTAWERWRALTPEQRDRYVRQARQYADRGRKAVKGRRRRR